MAPEQTRKHFAKLVESKGGPNSVAAQLNCSSQMISAILNGSRKPGMDLSRAIKELFKIPMEDWCEEPVFETVQRIALRK